MKFDYNFESFFPNEDDELQLYEKYRQQFEYDNEFVLVALENKGGIFRKNFLIKIDSLTQELSKLKFVKKVSSPTNLKNLSLGGFLPVETRVLHFEDETRYANDSAEIYKSATYVGSFFPRDAKSLSIFIKTDDVLSKRSSDELATTIQLAVDKFHFDDQHVAGRIFAQQVYLENIQKEFLSFLAISFVLVVVFLWFTFKRIYGVIVPVIIVLVSILWTLGIMHLMGKAIDIMAIMLPTMIFIAGVSDVVHFFSKYFDELALGTNRKKIVAIVIKEVGFPTFLTLLTTVVGFLSLLFSSIKPIREFGIYTSVGITIAFILTYTLLPAILYFFAPVVLRKKQNPNPLVKRILTKILLLVFRNQKLILVSTFSVVFLAVFGISKIKLNNILLEDLSDKMRIKQDFNFFDSHYSGVRPFEILVTVKDSSKTVWDYQVLYEINKVDQFVQKEYEAGFLISAASLAKNIYLLSVYDSLRLFPEEEDYKEIQDLLINNKKNSEFKKVIHSDGHQTRISGKIRDIGSFAMKQHNQKFQTFISDSIDSKLIQLEITGAAHLLDRNNETMVDNMKKGFLFSIAIIGLLTFLLHRSWRMVLVFIIPNLVPLAVIAGIMGYAGIELKAATALVFSIAFGIATDDTIHFISRIKLELSYGKSLIYAIKRTFYETGKPIMQTTFILIGGFFSLMTSNFESTFYFGFLICVTVAVALIADLFLLPVLLLKIFKTE